MDGMLSPEDVAAIKDAVAVSQRAPHALYVTGEDQLRLTVLNAAAAVTVTVRGRFERLDGRVVPFSTALVPATDRTASTATVRLGDGWLLGAQAFVSSGTPLTGQTFALLSLIRGEGAAALDLMTLAAGPITAQQRIGYPGSSIANSLDGGGALRTITGATPGAGAEISETVPTGARWELIAFQATFTASGAAANRIPSLVLDDGASIFFRFGVAAALTAGFVRLINWFRGAPSPVNDANNQIAIPIPQQIFLGAGYRIRTITTGIDVGDTYTLVRYVVREWLEGA